MLFYRDQSAAVKGNRFLAAIFRCAAQPDPGELISRTYRRPWRLVHLASDGQMLTETITDTTQARKPSVKVHYTINIPGISHSRV